MDTKNVNKDVVPLWLCKKMQEYYIKNYSLFQKLTEKIKDDSITKKELYKNISTLKTRYFYWLLLQEDEDINFWNWKGASGWRNYWLDHWGTYTFKDGTKGLSCEPYTLHLEDIEHIISFCKKYNCNFEINGRSDHTEESFRLFIYENKEKK